ncbi:MAG: NAD(P)H-binding protein [Steroidobacteraceae bacterium]
MKILIIGITGRLGKRIAGELLKKGHEVSGVNRRAARVPVVLGGLDIQTSVADTSDYNDILKCVTGADVVVLATAPTRENPDAYLEHNRNVIDAVKAAGVPRLIALSNYKALRAPDGRSMLEAEPPHPYFYDIEAVFAKEAALFRNELDLDWLLVAPPAELYPYGEVTRQYRVSKEMLLVSDPANTAYKDVSTLSMEDFAAFIADEIEQPSHHRELVTLAY